jgi:hypothetical protein
MARFKLFPRYWRPSLGELLGISQAERQVSRKHHLRIVHDPMSPLKNAERSAKRRAGYEQRAHAARQVSAQPVPLGQRRRTLVLAAQ